MKLSDYQVPEDIKYIAVFLTFSCNLRCSYCINRAGQLVKRNHLSAQAWIRGLSRFHTRSTLPLTLQGGEPTTYGGFYDVVRALPNRLPLDLLTNAQFNIGEFITKVPPSKFNREAPYSPIRVSYHRTMMRALDTIDRVGRLKGAGFKAGIWAVDVPPERDHNLWFAGLCKKAGIDFRWKEYLAPNHGTYKYPDSVWQDKVRTVKCRTSEILIDPAGNFFRCHADLYANRGPIGNIQDSEFVDFLSTRICHFYGQCSPCDTKLKTNYLQQAGHCSVEVSE